MNVSFGNRSGRMEEFRDVGDDVGFLTDAGPTLKYAVNRNNTGFITKSGQSSGNDYVEFEGVLLPKVIDTVNTALKAQKNEFILRNPKAIHPVPQSSEENFRPKVDFAKVPEPMFSIDVVRSLGAKTSMSRIFNKSSTPSG